MKPSLTDEFCTICGLCCDGSLLDDVELKSEREASGLELMGLQVDRDNDPALPLPCRALNGKLCRIYENRPKTCRRFECKLLQRTKRGAVSVDEAKAVIVKTQKQATAVKRICAEIEGGEGEGSLRERYQATLENQDDAKDPDQVLYTQLNKEMDSMEGLVDRYFIDL